MSRKTPGSFYPERSYDMYPDVASLGYDDDVTVVTVRGVNDNMSLNTPKTIWNGGPNDYTYLTGATSLYLSSSSASDTNTTIRVRGLDADWNMISYDTVLTGQTQVLVGDDFFRVRDMGIVAGSGDALVGEVYLAESGTVSGGVPTDLDTVKAKIANNTLLTETRSDLISDHFSSQAIYSVPANHIFLLERVVASSTGNEGFLTGRLKFDGADGWTSRNPIPVTNNRVEELFMPRLPIGEKTDLELRGTTSNNQTMSVRFDGILVRM